MKKYISILAAAALIVSLSACGGSGGSSAPSAPSLSENGAGIDSDGDRSGSMIADKSDGFGAAIGDGDGAYAAPEAEPSPGASFGEAAESPMAPSDRTDFYEKAEEIGSDSFYESSHEAQNKAGLLTAGEWRDNNNWPLWNSILTQRSEWRRCINRWQLNTQLRYRVCVTANGTPYNGATVKLKKGGDVLWTAVSDSRGTAFLFDTKNRTPDKVTVEIGGQTVSEHEITTSEHAAIGLDYEPDEIKIDLGIAPATKKKLDLMFVIDTTGSMSDELSYIQNELEDVINRVSNDNQIAVRLSVNFYRDIGDDYVLRNFEFTSDIQKALKDLKAQRAEGGGDYPEAVPNALEKAVFSHKWDKTEESEKLLFLVLDAPAHEKDADMLPQIISGAAKTGIRIIPVASSGVDTDTEYLCRSFAIMTGGTYTFLTDDSGIGYSHKEPTTGSYTVERLNDMMVRIIDEYFSSDPYNAVSGNTTGRIEEQPDRSLSLRCDYFQTSDYYGGSGFYGQTEIRSTNELYDFYDKYGYKEQLADFASGVDFNRSYIVTEVLCLSSGSVHIDSSHKFAAYDRNGKVEFDYELYMPSFGTDDMSAIFMVAEVPYAGNTIEPRDGSVGDTAASHGEDDTWIYEMKEVDDRVSDLMKLCEIGSLTTSEKADQVLRLLENLADYGTADFPYPLVDKNSICYNGHDMISFQYSCGVLGGVMLEPFDSMMN